MLKTKFKIRLIAAVIATILLTVSFYSCSSKGKTLMSLEKSEVSVNMYQFWLSRYKADYITNYMGGKNKAEFWDQIYDIQTNETNSDLLTKKITENAKTILAALYMFDELKLELPKGDIEKVDEMMADILAEVGEGSKTILNSELAKYGVNYNILKEIYINEQKIAYLQLYLFGEDASKISTAAKESYYQENYLHFKQIYLFSNVKPVYVKDGNGQEIYYNDDKKIAYDKENGTPDYVDDTPVKDDKGDTIYYKEDGKIAYDVVNGKRAYVYGDDGFLKTEECTVGEKKERKALADELLTRVEAGENFERLIQDYNEDIAVDQYANGFYYTAASPYYHAEILTALTEMEVGEVRLVNSAYGIHILKKYALDEGGYDVAANLDFFKDFNSQIMTEAFINKAAEYFDRIVIDKELLSLYSLKNVTPCYNY